MNRFKILKDKDGDVLLMTLMILTSILVVTLGVASLLIPNILMNRSQSYSLKAYFASETGAERSLWSLRKAGLVCGINNQCIDFLQNNCVECASPSASNLLGNNASYSVEYASSTAITLKSSGDYSGARRMVEVKISDPTCVPNCAGKTCGDDGCGGSCGSCSADKVCSSGNCIVDSFGGMYYQSVSSNPYTGVSSCLSGQSAYQFFSAEPSAYVCSASTSSPESSFGGIFSIADGGSCSNANSLTGACSCPTGFTSFPGYGASPGDPFSISMSYCMNNNPASMTSFGGGYYAYSSNYYAVSFVCKIANPITGACSCPSGYNLGRATYGNPAWVWFYCYK